MAPAPKSPNKVEEYRRTLQDLAVHSPKKVTAREDSPEEERIARRAAELEGKAAKLATEIQGEQSKAPPVKPTIGKR